MFLCVHTMSTPLRFHVAFRYGENERVNLDQITKVCSRVTLLWSPSGLTGYIPWYNHHGGSDSFSVVDFLGYSKSFISFIKYVPQVPACRLVHPHTKLICPHYGQPGVSEL